MINREIISDVRNSLRSVTADTWIPAKYIFSKLAGITALFIKREADDKRLFRYTELWATIDCLKMEEVDLVSCCDIAIPNCTKVMKSVEKLPESYSTRFGYLLNVSTVDYSKDYVQTTPQQYKYTKSREYQDRSKRYFWIDNGYLIIPDSMAERVRVRGMFTNKANALKLNSCDNSNNCVRFMDQEFVAPEHLIQDIKAATIADIIKTYKSITPDELTNANENEKTNPKP